MANMVKTLAWATVNSTKGTALPVEIKKIKEFLIKIDYEASETMYN